MHRVRSVNNVYVLPVDPSNVKQLPTPPTVEAATLENQYIYHDPTMKVCIENPLLSKGDRKYPPPH